MTDAPGDIVRVCWGGWKFRCVLDRWRENETWEAVSLDHTGRTTDGTRIVINPSEIIERGQEADRVDIARIETAMAEERRSLPHPRELIAAAQAKAQNAKAAP
jgi:hypothetical protein